ncbi:MAG: TRAP transporter TatT component family protein [Desulfobacterales bacterium]|nr:TRAP transporter TatT component family protein [Desulfobacterales bacterium]
MKKTHEILIIMFLSSLFSVGCVKMALRVSPSLIPNFTSAFFEECDPDLAEQSLPSNLKLLEGLLKNDPDNRQLLTSLCMGFTGYAMLFVEDDDPERASTLYSRARTYGFRATGRNASRLKDAGLKKDIVRSKLLAYGEEEIGALFWTAISWNAWINLNLDKPAVLAQLGAAQACLERVLEIQPDYFHGLAYIMMGSISAAMPMALGGKAGRAKTYLEKAIGVSNGKFLLAQYYFPRYYAARVQDKELFLKLIKEVESSPSDGLKEVCLINAVMKKKTKRLMEMSEDLFF